MNVRTILCPTDFSEGADRALAFAVELADRFGATLHILHVVNKLDPEWYGPTDVQTQEVELQDQIHTEAQNRLQEIAPPESHLDVYTNVSVQLNLDVADSINEYVGEHAIDLVVMGTHGRQGIRRLMLGSVADSLIRQAPCPVMTVPTENSGTTDADDVTFQEILAPIDFSAHSRKALGISKMVAHQYEAHLHLLFVAEKRVVPTFSDTGVPGVGVVEMDPDIVENARSALEQLDGDVGGPSVKSSYHVRKGEVARDIVDFAETNEIRLIVMATRGLTGVDRFLLGSSTERVVRVAPCPVLTIPASATDEQTE